MRISRGALARIIRSKSGTTQLLTQWNASWDAYSPIGGQLEDGETFRACLVREIREELQLEESVDLAIPMNPISLICEEAFSRNAQQMTQYELAIFSVEFLSDDAIQSIGSRPENRWVSEEEIRRGKTRDGIAVSVTSLQVFDAKPTELRM